MTGTRELSAALGADIALETAGRALALSDSDETEVAVSTRSGEFTRFADDRIHQAQDMSEWSVSIRCVAGGGSGRATTNDLSAIAEAVGRAGSLARSQAGRARGDAPPVSGPAPAPDDAWGLRLWDPDVVGFDVETRSAKARGALVTAARAGGRAAGMLGRAVTELAVVTSGGSARYAAATEVSGSLTVRIGDGSSHWVDLDRRLATLDLDAAIGSTMRAAVATQGREDLPAGTFDVVLGPLAVGGMLESIAAYGFTGTQLAAGVGAVSQRAGEQVASRLVTLNDDAAADRGLPFPFDAEGSDKQRVTLLDRGAVGSAVTDLATGARTGLGSTGHAHIAREESPAPVPANLQLTAGESGVDDLVAGVENGVYVQRFWYLRVVDPVSTTLTGVSRDACWRIEGGRLTTPVRGARWTERLFGVLSRVDGVSRERLCQPLANVWNGSVTAPALRVRGFTFGAAARP